MKIYQLMKKYCHFFYSTREGRVQTEISSFTLDVVVNILKPLVKVNKKLGRRKTWYGKLYVLSSGSIYRLRGHLLGYGDNPYLVLSPIINPGDAKGVSHTKFPSAALACAFFVSRALCGMRWREGQGSSDRAALWRGVLPHWNV
jgi:hypothetical protein